MLLVEQSGGVRHPDDPDPVESTKVVAAFTLAVLAVIFSPFVGGAIPALVALMLARQAEADIRASEGFLLGAGRLRKVRRMAWIALGVAAAVVIALLLVWVVTMARTAGEPSLDGDFASALFG